jgi:hypothetical protein
MSKSEMKWLLALGGFLFTYLNTKTIEERKARIERVNRQLELFYGPLLACVSATASAKRAMIKQMLGSEGIREESLHAAVKRDPTIQKAYQQWMELVLQPLNERAAKVVIENIDLLEGSSIQKDLLQLVSHVAANRVLISSWKDANSALSFSSAIPYPDRLEEFIGREFSKMKRIQADLLGAPKPQRSKL